MTLKEQMINVGLTPRTAARRSNRIKKEGRYMENAVSWGIKTFGSYAPTQVKEFEGENSDLFKAVAHIAYVNGYKKHA